MTVKVNDEFWWLPEGMVVNDLHVYVGHHEPAADTEEPLEIPWYHSIDDSNSTTAKLYPADILSRWRERWDDRNVYRSMTAYTSPAGRAFWGPFLVDIDNEQEDISDALNVARAAVRHFVGAGVAEDSMRVFFSGRKGLHLEVRPDALGVSDDGKGADVKRTELIDSIREGRADESFGFSNQASKTGTIIDMFHEYIRLAGSINCWLDERGASVGRRKLRLTVRELEDLDADEVLDRAHVPQAALKVR